MSSIFDADKIAQTCFDFYAKNLMTKSKPAPNEWTNLAAIVCLDADKYKILSIATGTKCLAEKQLPLDGSLVHDSHAEVLARRCFMRYLYQEIENLADDRNYTSEFLELNREENGLTRFRVKSHIKLILFTSHTPCGDASIIPKKQTSKRALDEDDDDDELIGREIKRQKVVEDDIHRTGAKCVSSSELKDPKESGSRYHVTGVLRTKPGRGDPTISMSCSDKIAKWLVLGLQGALLSVFLKEPIYLDAIVVAKCPFDIDCMNRALIERSLPIRNLTPNYRLSKPQILQSNLQFIDSKLAKIEKSTDLKACPNSVCWNSGSISQKPIFVLVKGNLQGVGKKITKKHFPPICKFKFFESFERISVKLGEPKSSLELNYSDAKKLPQDYNHSYEEFSKIFSDWIKTDYNKYYEFKI